MAEVLAGIGAWGPGAAAPPRSPALEAAVRGWIFFVEGVVLQWLERRDLEREQLRELLRSALLGSLEAARAIDPGIRIDFPPRSPEGALIAPQAIVWRTSDEHPRRADARRRSATARSS